MQKPTGFCVMVFFATLWLELSQVTLMKAFEAESSGRVYQNWKHPASFAKMTLNYQVRVRADIWRLSWVSVHHYSMFSVVPVAILWQGLSSIAEVCWFFVDCGLNFSVVKALNCQHVFNTLLHRICSYYVCTLFPTVVRTILTTLCSNRFNIYSKLLSQHSVKNHCCSFNTLPLLIYPGRNQSFILGERSC